MIARRILATGAWAVLAALPAPLLAGEETADSTGRGEPLPGALEEVGITEHRNERLPLDLRLTDENGDAVRLGDYCDGERPVILNLAYYTCPMLCDLVLNGMVEALQKIDSTPGDAFTIVTVSFDPTETVALARLKKQNYIQAYGRPEAASGWHFHVGEEENVRALADAVGFRYTYNEERGEYAHAAAIYVCTPDGRLSRYLYGVQFDPSTLRLSLVEAAEGKIGSPIDQILLYCFHYDATEGRYAPAALNIMRGGGILALVAIGTLLLVLWRRDAARKNRS